MSFPSTYKNKFILTTDKTNNFSELNTIFFQEISIMGTVENPIIENKSIKFDILSLFNIRYPVEMEITQQENIRINYEVKLQKLIQISIILVIFTAFFSSFGVSDFLWFSLVLVIAFYGINILFVDNAIKNLIKSSDLYKETQDDSDDSMSNEQQQWMNDINKCPACGELLEIFGNTCPECGLKLPHPQIFKPYDVSKYRSKKIKYTYKKNNKNES